MFSSTSRGVHPPSFHSQLISFHLRDNSVNIWPLSSTRDREKGTRWLQWEGENSVLTDGWYDSYVLSQGWTIKILLALEILQIFLLTGISKRNIFCRTVFRCLSPFKIGIHIYLEQSVWAELSCNPFWKCIASICFGPNHSGKKIQGIIWIFEKVIFNFYAEIGFFGLTWRVTLL